MSLQATNAQSFISNPSALLSLYEIDSRYISVNGQILRFHAGVNGLYRSLVFNGLEYTAYPIEMTDYAINGQGEVARPKIRAANINGFLSNYLRVQGDMVGAKFIRRRVYARFVDAVNFDGGTNPFGTPNASAAYEDEVFFINRKINENPEMVEWELSTPFEIGDVQLPNRIVTATVCMAKPYRDPETCGYNGAPLMDRFGTLFIGGGGYGFQTLTDKGVYATGIIYNSGDYVEITSLSDFSAGDTFVYVCKANNVSGNANNPQFNSAQWIPDACPHNLSGCQAHFPGEDLRFLAFPGVSRSSFVDL